MAKSKEAVSATVETDVLVIGGGLAGTYAAIKAREAGVPRVTLVSKGKLGKDSMSTFAAGVFTLVEPEDDKEALFKMYALNQTFAAGLYDKEWLNVWLNELYDRVMELDEWGLDWQKTPEGKLERRGMRGNIRAMFPGPQLMKLMAKKVKQSGIDVIGHTIITDLLTENGRPGSRVTGAVGFEVRTGAFRVFKAKSIVLAAGPCGFKGRFAGHKFQTGEACAMSYRAGALMGQFENGWYLQLTATEFDTQGMNMFATLGGHFLNANGERFMEEYDPELKDNSSLARLAQASAMEVRAGRGPIYFDLTHFTPDNIKRLRTVLPLPAMILERAGVLVGDKIVRKVEWAPAFWGTISLGGGVVANTRCETSLPGLYACGDAMARFASGPRALPAAAVTGARAGQFAAEYARQAKEPRLDEQQVKEVKKVTFAPLTRKDGIEPEHVIVGIQETINPFGVSIILREDRLQKAIAEIERIRDEEVPLLFASDAHYLRLAHEAGSMALVAEMILRSWLLRKESRVTFLREDYPYTDNINWLKHTRLRQEDGTMKLWAEDMPTDRYKVLPAREKQLHPVFEIAKRRGIEWG